MKNPKKSLEISKIIKSIILLSGALNDQNLLSSNNWNKIEFYIKKLNEKNSYLMANISVKNNLKYSKNKTNFLEGKYEI